MSGQGHVAGEMYMEASIAEMSGRGSIRRATVLRGSVSLRFVHEEVSIGAMSV